jgi:hypothetical protein
MSLSRARGDGAERRRLETRDRKAGIASQVVATTASITVPALRSVRLRLPLLVRDRVAAFPGREAMARSGVAARPGIVTRGSSARSLRVKRPVRSRLCGAFGCACRSWSGTGDTSPGTGASIWTGAAFPGREAMARSGVALRPGIVTRGSSARSLRVKRPVRSRLCGALRLRLALLVRDRRHFSGTGASSRINPGFPIDALGMQPYDRVMIMLATNAVTARRRRILAVGAGARV